MIVMELIFMCECLRLRVLTVLKKKNPFRAKARTEKEKLEGYSGTKDCVNSFCTDCFKAALHLKCSCYSKTKKIYIFLCHWSVSCNRSLCYLSPWSSAERDHVIIGLCRAPRCQFMNHLCKNGECFTGSRLEGWSLCEWEEPPAGSSACVWRSGRDWNRFTANVLSALSEWLLGGTSCLLVCSAFKPNAGTCHVWVESKVWVRTSRSWHADNVPYQQSCLVCYLFEIKCFRCVCVLQMIWSVCDQLCLCFVFVFFLSCFVYWAVPLAVCRRDLNISVRLEWNYAAIGLTSF